MPSYIGPLRRLAPASDRYNAMCYSVALREFIASPTLETAAEQLTMLFGARPQRYGISTGQQEAPAACGGSIGTDIIILIRGLESAENAIYVTNGALMDKALRGANQISRAMDSPAEHILNSLGAVLTREIQYVRIAGHSWGGAIAVPMALSIRRPTWSREQAQVISFGAPKAASDTGSQAQLSIDQWRFMNLGDSIPTAPMDASAAPILHAILAPGYSRNLSAWSHWSPGTRMHHDAILHDDPVPPEGGPWTDASFAYFLVSNAAETAINHKIEEYARRLIIWDDRNPTNVIRPSAANSQLTSADVPVAEPTPSTAPATPSGSTPPREVSLALMKAAQVPLVYSARKVNGIPTLFAADVPVATFKSSKAAKSTASRLNGALKTWAKSTQGDEAALGSSVSGLFQSSDD